MLQAHYSMDAKPLNLVRPEVPVGARGFGRQDDGEGPGPPVPNSRRGCGGTQAFFQEGGRGREAPGFRHSGSLTQVPRWRGRSPRPPR